MEDLNTNTQIESGNSDAYLALFEGSVWQGGHVMNGYGGSWRPRVQVKQYAKQCKTAAGTYESDCEPGVRSEPLPNSGFGLSLPRLW